MKEIIQNKRKLILFTMRSDIDPKDTSNSIKGNYLSEAVEWFKKNDIPLYGIQKNPTQHTWTSSPKAYGQLIIDDSALGCPLIFPSDGGRPYVNWTEVREILINRKIIV